MLSVGMEVGDWDFFILGMTLVVNLLLRLGPEFLRWLGWEGFLWGLMPILMAATLGNLPKG